MLSGISSTVLAARLLELEREGLVSKKIYPQIPPKVEYRLTLQAKELEVILRDLSRWAHSWRAPEITASKNERSIQIKKIKIQRLCTQLSRENSSSNSLVQNT